MAGLNGEVKDVNHSQKKTPANKLPGLNGEVKDVNHSQKQIPINRYLDGYSG
ncbi:MAG: hypothetical protein K8R02_01190 [Anaerohalosphaeraceae bacterium]|nr:hypothetical protein [Anaerohalosphaeraceae bacterium]